MHWIGIGHFGGVQICCRQQLNQHTQTQYFCINNRIRIDLSSIYLFIGQTLFVLCVLGVGGMAALLACDHISQFHMFPCHRLICVYGIHNNIFRAFVGHDNYSRISLSNSFHFIFFFLTFLPCVCFCVMILVFLMKIAVAGANTQFYITHFCAHVPCGVCTYKML